MRRLEFGWFLPTAGDTTAYGLASAQVPPSLPLFDKIVAAAEAAGFEYMLVPVQTACWEAWISSAMMVARSKSMRMLVAARPSYINPVLLAKMISTFDQLSGGRICINLIAGQSEAENASEGIKWGKEERYEIMDEEVSILKALWTTRGPVTFDGKFYQLKGAQIRPYPLQQPYPRFYLGGGSMQAWEISAKHSDVHLFWGDTYERIRANMAEIKGMAARHGRENDIGFGMRLQVVCRPTATDMTHEITTRPRRSCATSRTLCTVMPRSFSMRSATAANSRPAAVIWTRRVLRSNSRTPSCDSSRFSMRVSAGREILRLAAAAKKLPDSPSASTASSWRAPPTGSATPPSRPPACARGCARAGSA